MPPGGGAHPEEVRGAGRRCQPLILAAAAEIASVGLATPVAVPVAAAGVAVVANGAGSVIASGQTLAMANKAAEAERAAGGGPRVNKVGPHPEAQGPHTSFKRAPTGKVTGYTEFNAAGNPVKRFRGEGKPHGGVDPPLVLEPKPGKGPGSPPKVPRAPHPDELPKGYDLE